MLKDNLKKYRIASNLSQKQVADALQVAATTYASYEQGKSEPSLERLQEIASILKVTVEKLLSATGPLSSANSEPIIVKGDYVGPVSPDEREELMKYLDFIRSKK